MWLPLGEGGGRMEPHGVVGATIEALRWVGLGEGFPSPPGKGSGERAVPLPRKCFRFFELKKASFGAFWD